MKTLRKVSTILEVLLISLMFLALILNFKLIPGGLFLTIIVLCILSFFYSALGWSLFGIEKQKLGGLILGIPTGICLSVVCMALLFKIQAWPGSSAMALMGSVMLSILLVVSIAGLFIPQLKTHFSAGALPRLFIHLGIAISITIFLLSVSSHDITRFRYRHHPKYLELIEAYRNNPTEENREAKDAYYREMFR